MGFEDPSKMIPCGLQPLKFAGTGWGPDVSMKHRDISTPVPRVLHLACVADLSTRGKSRSFHARGQKECSAYIK